MGNTKFQVISNNFNIQYDFNTVLFQSKNNQDYSGGIFRCLAVKAEQGRCKICRPTRTWIYFKLQKSRHCKSLCESKWRSISQTGYPANPLLLVHVMIMNCEINGWAIPHSLLSCQHFLTFPPTNQWHLLANWDQATMYLPLEIKHSHYSCIWKSHCAG